MAKIFFKVFGKTIGIMGATGSGKSSIVNLLQRFYDVTDGVVKVDGTDVRKLSLKQLRSSISVVLQDVFLFSDTIEENIKMGQRKVMPFDEIRRAADCAQAKDFIEKMDEPSSVSAVSDFPADKSSVSVLRVPLQKRRRF